MTVEERLRLDHQLTDAPGIAGLQRLGRLLDELPVDGTEVLVNAVVLFFGFGFAAGLSLFYALGVVAAAALLWWQHRALQPDHLGRLGPGLFTANGILSVVMLAAGALDMHAALRNDAPLHCTGKQALHILDVCLSILESGESGTPRDVTSRFDAPEPVYA